MPPFLPHPDETIHSFIYRICAIHGLEHLSDVTNGKGEWATTLRINKSVRHHFSELSDQHFIDLVQKIGWANKTFEIFDDPTSYMSIIRKLLTGENVNRIRNLSGPIRFCAYCIRDTIASHGYGYFKIDWYLTNSNYCSIHQSVLTIVNCDTKLQSLATLKTIIKGIIPYGSYCPIPYFTDGASKYVRFPGRPHHLQDILETEDGEFIQIASCLRDSIKEWLDSDSYEPPPVVNEIDSQSAFYSMCKIETRLKHEKVLLGKVIIVLYKNRFEPFMNFWNNVAVKHRVYCGVINRKNVSESLYIYENPNNCKNCSNVKCPANQSDELDQIKRGTPC